MQCTGVTGSLRPHLRVGSSGGKGILLEIPIYLMPSRGKQIFSFASASTVAAFGHISTCCGLGLCNSAVVAVFFRCVTVLQ